MCILSVEGLTIKTIIAITSKSLLYVNDIKNTTRDSDNVPITLNVPPCMCFSFNGEVKNVNIWVNEIKDIIKQYDKYKTLWHGDEDECDSVVFDSVKVTKTKGYIIFTGPRLDVYKKACSEYTSPKERELLFPLIDSSIVHGENAVYAIPESANNDWTGIELIFNEDVKDIIIPTCHEYKDTSEDERYIYDQLLIIDRNLSKSINHVLSDKEITRHCYNSNTKPTEYGFYDITRKDLVKLPNKTLKLPIWYKLQLKSELNINIKLRNLITVA